MQVPEITISVSQLYEDLADKGLEELKPYRQDLREFIKTIEEPLTSYITSGEAFSDTPATALESLGKIDTLLAQMVAYGEEIKARTAVVCMNEKPFKVRAINAETTAQIEYIKGLQNVLSTTITSIKKTMDAVKQ